MIWETAVYDGAIKKWRIVNLTAGTIYSTEFDTEEGALLAIADGEVRGKETVRMVKLYELCLGLAALREVDDAFDARVSVPLKRVN